MKNYLKYRISVAFFAIALLSVFLLPAHAKALTLTPTRFEISGNPGDTLTEEFTLINEDNTVGAYYSSFANFGAQGDSGSPAFISPKDDLGTWITTQDSVSLSPREQKTIPFVVHIPKDAEPGGHFAVVFWGTSAPNTTGVSIGAKTGILVLLSVNGDVKQDAGLLSFNTLNHQFWFKTLPVAMEYRFRNDGGDRIKPVGTIRVSDTLFLPADKFDANPGEGNVLPNSTRKIAVNWIKYERPPNYVEPAGTWKKFWSNTYYEWKNFAIGLYSAHLKVTYGASAHAAKTVFFFVFPWQLVLVLVLGIFILWWGGKKLIKRYNRFIIERARAGMHKEPSQSSHG